MEVGASGEATVSLARRGFRVTVSSWGRNGRRRARQPGPAPPSSTSCRARSSTGARPGTALPACAQCPGTRRPSRLLAGRSRLPGARGPSFVDSRDGYDQIGGRLPSGAPARCGRAAGRRRADRAQRAVRRRCRGGRRLGGHRHRRPVSGAPRHLLRPRRHAEAAAGAPATGSSDNDCALARGTPSAPLGRGAAPRPPPASICHRPRSPPLTPFRCEPCARSSPTRASRWPGSSAGAAWRTATSICSPVPTCRSPESPRGGVSRTPATSPGPSGSATACRPPTCAAPPVGEPGGAGQDAFRASMLACSAARRSDTSVACGAACAGVTSLPARLASTSSRTCSV